MEEEEKERSKGKTSSAIAAPAKPPKATAEGTALKHLTLRGNKHDI